MRALSIKLWRDLWLQKGQAAAIAAVIGAGVMILVLGATSLAAVRDSQQRFYQDYHFADVFVDLKRAPDHVAERLRAITGVQQVEARVQAPVRLEVEGFDDPVRGLLVSIPDGRQPLVNRLHLREGSLPEPGRADQVLLNEPFAEAHGLRAGDRLKAIINGRLETLSVSGIALSPEFIYQVGPADILPDYERFGVLWMNRRALARAYDMDGAFNHVGLTLQAGAQPQAVIGAVDAALARYGGIGAHDRDDQTSHFFVTENQQRMGVLATVLPVIFLGVAAFLINVLMGRIIRTQRQQIAVLKAFGYGNAEVAGHYLAYAGLIALLGSAFGIALGAWAAGWLAGIYAEYFRFPTWQFRLEPRVLALGIGVAAGAALIGAWRAVARALAEQPAEAMRPPMPESFRRGWLERSHLDRLIDQPTRIILRNLGRHRFKASMSALGIGLSCGLVLLGSYQFGSVNHMMDIQYGKVLLMDVHASFTDPTPARAVAELNALPGVVLVEAYRAVPVRLRVGSREHRTSLRGLEPTPRLNQLLDAAYRPQTLPDDGLAMTRWLAEDLGLRPGDLVEIEVMEGHRRVLDVPLVQLVDEPFGAGAYMERRALNRLLREGPAISGVWLLTDRALEAELFDRLWEHPRVASIGLIAQAEQNIRDYLNETFLGFMGILLLLAATVAFAVVYNNARIAFAERERELASLRVLGYTRAEVAWILIGEMVVLVALAIPIGWLVGTGLAWAANRAMASEMFRLPFVLSPGIYAFSALAVIVAAAASVWLIGRRLNRLDMVSALKTE
ncbi:MAG: ABC transporter permease [Wenzhouxiangella sp.]|nr:MAG: ABC transporter permease [Wenzhouxiangella sp.]